MKPNKMFLAVSRHETMERLGLVTSAPVLHDRYELRSIVGSGSFGVVFRAWDRVLERVVAIKHAETADLGEARALAAIRHPCVVTIFDVSSAPDGVILAMEFLDGERLSDWIENDYLASADVLEVFARLAEGVGAVHAAGLVHADLKPSNVIVTKRGPLLVDFGLAMSGVAGALKYMAPEVRRGGAPTALADQYSFCLMLVELIGPALRGRRARAVRRGLSPTPADRWPDMTALAQALRPQRHRVGDILARILQQFERDS